jgi:PilZ domain
MVDDDKRVATRRKVLKTAKIVTFDKKTVLNCAIRDLSETGAKLIVEVSSAIPNEFQFFLQSDNTVRDAKVMWRKAGQIGVHFTSPPQPAPTYLRLAITPE